MNYIHRFTSAVKYHSNQSDFICAISTGMSVNIYIYFSV